MKYIPGILVLLAFIAIMIFAVIDGLSAENWYSDKHDSQCEKLASKSDCGCYERFVKKAKERK